MKKIILAAAVAVVAAATPVVYAQTDTSAAETETSSFTAVAGNIWDWAVTHARAMFIIDKENT